MAGDEVTRPLIIGEAPSRTAGAARALDGRSGERLARLLGVGLDQLLERFETANLLERWPGPAGRKGAAFPARMAREAAERVRLRGSVLLAGRRVAAAFRLSAPYFEWATLRGARVAVIPHPSGVNRWWNDPANRERAAAFLREVVG
jgi:uracil-DNA glycosylase